MTESLNILCSSSLEISGLNKHILDAIKNSSTRFLPFAKFTFVSPDRAFASLANSESCDIFLFIGSSYGESCQLISCGLLARQKRAVTIFWATDDPYEHDSRFLLDSFDIYLTNEVNCLHSFTERENVFHLPLAGSWDSDFMPIPADMKKERMILFAGYPYQNRRLALLMLNSLLDKFNISLDIFSADWGDYGCTNINCWPLPQSHERLISLYSRSSLVINMGRSYSLANTTKKVVADTPGPRTFEIALSGSAQLYLGESEVDKYLLPGKQIFVCTSTASVDEFLRSFVAEPNFYQDIARSAQMEVASKHLYEDRLLDIIKKALPFITKKVDYSRLRDQIFNWKSIEVLPRLLDN